MKITIDIDCTPEEVREALGMPDVKPMQGVLLAALEEHLKNAMDSTMEKMDTMDMATLMQTWLPTNIQGLDGLQKAFWANMASNPGKTPKTPPSE